MTIKEFAERYRLRLAKDDDGEPIIAGRPDQTSIFEHAIDGSVFAAMFMTDGMKPPRTELFNKFKAACLTAKMTPSQIGDAEGTFLFDPNDRQQAVAAIKSAKARGKRRVNPEQAAEGAARLAAFRTVKSLVLNPSRDA